MSFLNLLENESLAAWLANSAGQLIIISILGFIAVKLLSGKSAPARSVTSAGALVSMLLVFILSVVFQASNIAWYKADVSRFTATQPPAPEKPVEKAPIVVKPAVAAAPEQMAAPENISMPALPAPSDINMENAFQAKPAPAKTTVISPKPGKPFLLKAAHCVNALGLLWLCGIIFMLLKLGYGLAFIRGFRFGLNRIIDARVDRLLKIAAETFNKQRLPELYTSPQVESPVTIGMTNPIVIIPEKLFATLSENELKSILLHELAHIYHYDHIIGVFKRIIIAANWWNPLAYRVSAKHAVAREEVADNYVLRELNPKVYSECLAGLAEKICLISSYPAAAGMAGNYSSLQHRVKDIMSKKRKLTMTTGTTFKLATAAVCLILALVVAGCRCGKPDPVKSTPPKPVQSKAAADSKSTAITSEISRDQEDLKIYSKEDLKKVDELLKSLSIKWSKGGEKEVLNTLITKYGKANRVGIGVLCLGLMSKGDEQIKYLQMAIDDFGDCFLGRLQVGAYARYILARAYLKNGDKAKADKLIEEIKTKYPDSIVILQLNLALDMVDIERSKAGTRRLEDSKKYSEAQLKEIDALYQSVNKKLNSEESKASLNTLLTKYNKANKTGWALLSLGFISKGDEQAKYLQMAINDFSDCFDNTYGVQVGAYARYLLAGIYTKNGEKDKAAKLIEEIKTDFPDSIDYYGKSLVSTIAADSRRAKNVSRMQEDSKTYSKDDLSATINLYQTTDKKWGSEEAKASLNTLLAKYPKANITGCALLRIGEMSKGDEQIKYLRQAIDGFSDCFWGDGVQVGPYARLLLARIYLKNGEKAEAAKLIEELKTSYPDAVDHKGNSLALTMALTEPVEQGLTTSNNIRKIGSIAGYWNRFKWWQTLHDLQKTTGAISKEEQVAVDALGQELTANVYLVKFKPNNSFDPATPQELMANFNKFSSLQSKYWRNKYDRVGGAADLKTAAVNNQLIGALLTEEPEQMKKDLAKNPSLLLISCEKVTPEMLVKHSESEQEYLMDKWKTRGPIILETIPANGAKDVDPNLTQITVKFDRKMGNTSWSVCTVGSGSELPISGKLFYDDSCTVFTVPVKLQPGRTYATSLNAERFIGFVSADGVPLYPYPLSFTTKAVSGTDSKSQPPTAAPAADSKGQAASDYQVSGTIPADFEPRANAKGEILFFEPKNVVLVARMNVQADANGGFHISLPANSPKATALRAEIQFLSESFAPLRANGKVSPGKPWAVDFAEPFKKQDAVHYTGVFLDDISNEPVPYVGVYADASSGKVLARADEKGRFDFYAVPSWGGMTSFLPWVSSDQYAGHSYFFKHNAGESVELKLIMERGVRVRVHTEDEQGVALPGVYVRWMGGGGAAGTTDEHGDAILSGMLSRVRPGELTEVRKTGYELAKKPGPLSAMLYTDKPLRIVLRRVADSSTPQAAAAAKTDSAATDSMSPQQKAKIRMQEDSKIYSKSELSSIETLYQSANKDLSKAEAKTILQTLIAKYKKANRAGCALLYLGQISQGEEQIKYLQQAIADGSDCFYGDGVQVGAYARYYLYYAYLAKGEKNKAMKLLEEIKTDYPGAINHSGDNLVALMTGGLQKDNARKRMEEDFRTYSQDDLKKIGELCTIVFKQGYSPNAKESLNTLLTKYPKANSTGLALLRMGEMSKGDEQIKYLQQVIADFGNCYNWGIHTGPYARLLLARIYLKNGDTTQAVKLLEEIKNLYPEACDKKGNRIASIIAMMDIGGQEQSAAQKAIRSRILNSYWDKFKWWQALHELQEKTGPINQKEQAEVDALMQGLLKNIYLVKFKPVNGFNPLTPNQFLTNFGTYSTLRSNGESVGGASFFRTTDVNNQLIGSFLTEEPEKMKADIEKNPSLQFLSSEKVTQETFVKHVESEQQSLMESFKTKGPKILETIPANGAKDVDPNLTKIIVKFDRKMRNGSWAVCNVGIDKQLPIEGSMSYNSSCTTLTIPVKLQPNHPYATSLNMNGYIGFVSADGVPLYPYPLSFTTKAVPGTDIKAVSKEAAKPEARAQSPLFNAASIIAQDGCKLSAAEVVKLEQKVARNPEDIKSISLLLEYYFGGQAGNTVNGILQKLDNTAEKQREKYILWLIENHPEADVLGSDCGRLYSPVTKKLWLEQLEKHPDNLKIVANGAHYFANATGDDYGDLAIKYFNKAKILDPGNSYFWDYYLGAAYESKSWQLLKNNKQDPESVKQASGYSETALGHYENAFTHSPEKENIIVRGNMTLRDAALTNIVKIAFKVGNLNKVAEYAGKMSPDSDRAFFLGIIAAQKGNIDTAGECLLAYGKALQKNRVWPDLSLANGLLKNGKRNIVLEFLKACSKFRQSDGFYEQLIKEIENGGTPDLSEPAMKMREDSLQKSALKLAQTAAAEWLALMDEGKYLESWTAAATSLKEKETADAWQRMLKTERGSLGKVLSRKFGGSSSAADLSQKLVFFNIQHETVFENGQVAIETIDTIPDKDGQWRVSRYYIRKIEANKETAKPEVAVSDQDRAVKMAQTAAIEWLALVNGGKYPESWTAAATLFKGAVTADAWTQMLKIGQTPFGKVLSRKVKSAVYRTSLPGAPDGQYVVIQYDTTFENKKDAVETVTPMLDKDGQWRVSGYYIK